MSIQTTSRPQPQSATGASAQPVAKDTAPQPAAEGQAQVKPFSVIVHGSGTQGKAFAAMVVASGELQGRKVEVYVVARDAKKFLEKPVVRTEDGKQSVDLSKHVKVIDKPFAGADLIINAVPGGVTPGTLNDVQKFAPGSTVMMTHNGTTPPGSNFTDLEIIRAISMAVTREEGGQTVIAPNSFMKVGKDGKHAGTVDKAWSQQSLVRIDKVDNIAEERWKKIAVNTALGSITTLFGKKIGEIKEMAKSDPRILQLIRGLADEVIAAGRATKEITISDDEGFKPTHEFVFGGNFDNHPMSMQTLFRKGEDIEIPLHSGGISGLGTEHGVPTPLNTGVADVLNRYVTVRDWDKGLEKEEGQKPKEFYQEYAKDRADAIEDLLTIASMRPKL